MPRQNRQPIADSDISIYICLIDIRSKSKEQLNERREGLSIITLTTTKPLTSTLTPLIFQQQASMSEIMPDSD